jgi:head-tail adaptor
MRYDDKVIELTATYVDDPWTGERIEEWVEAGSIDANVAPVSADVQLRAYGFVTNRVVKVLTRDEINGNSRYVIDGVTYVVRQYKRHKHRRNFLLLEALK